MGTSRQPGRAWRAAASVVVVALVASTVSVVTAPPVAAATPEETALRDAVADWVGGLAGLDGLDDLAQAVPFSDVLPAGPDGLDLADAVTQAAVLLDSIANPTVDALETALNDLDGDTLGSAMLHVAADVTESSVTFTELRVTADRTVPLDIDEGPVSLDGIDVAVEFELALTDGGPLTFAFDALTGLAITQAPLAAFRIDAGADLATGIEANLGILGVDVVGTGPGTVDDVAIDSELAVAWVDPDGTAPITQTEWQNTAAIDLWDLSCTTATAELHLALESDFTGGAQATIDVVDDVCDGLDIEPSDVSLGDLAPFTNLSAFDAVNAIAQFAQTLRTLQFSAGSVRSIQSANGDIADDLVSGIPFLDQDLPNLVDVSQELQQFFIDNGISTAEAPFDLGFGDEDAVDIDELKDALVEKGLGSIQDIIEKLGTSLGEDLGLAYDATSQTITFDYPIVTPASSTTEFTDGGADDIRFDFGDRLLGAGLRGVQATSSASLSVDASYTADIGVGIDLAPGIPQLTDRVFVETDGVELGADVLVEGNADLVGSIGLLGVELGSGGVVDVLGRADSGSPMISIDLQSDAGSLTLREILDGLMAVEDAETTLTGTNQLAIDLGPAGSPVGTVVGTINAAIPETVLAAKATIGETELAGATLTLGWGDVTDPDSMTLVTDGEFNDELLAFNLDTDDPLALLTQILAAVDAGLKQLDALLEEDLLDTQIPVVGTSAGELFTQLQAIRKEILAIVEDPAGSLDLLEAQIELAIAEALGIAGAPEIPDPADFFDDPDGTPESGDEVFDAADYEAAFTQWATVDLPAFLADKADFLTFGWEPGNSPGALTVGLNLGICSAKSEAPTGYLCQHEAPLERSFELSLADLGVPDLGGVIGTEGDFSFALDYFLGARLDFGVDLPEVTSSADGLPDIIGTPRVFIEDTSGIQAKVAGEVSGEFGGRLGPFGIKVGDESATGPGAEDCGNNADDDGDGLANDGCPQVGGIAEADDQCTNTSDDDPESDGDDPPNDVLDGAVNDGCPAVASPFSAEAGVGLSVGDPGATGTRVYLDDGTAVADFFDAVTFEPSEGADCGDGPTYACATLPFFLTEEGSPPDYLATLEIDVPDFTDLSTATVDGGSDLATALAAALKQLLWRLIGEGLGEVGDYVEESLATASHGVDIPLIGDALDAGADIGAAFNQGLVNPIESFLTTFDPTNPADVETGLQTFLYDQLTGPAGLTLGDIDGTAGVTADDVMVDARCGGSSCTGGETIFEVDRLDVAFTIGDEIVDGSIPFDFGFPGLRLASTDPINTSVNWNLDVGFGLSADRGFYLVTDRSQILDGALADRPELGLNATLDVVGSGLDPEDATALEGDLSFIKVEVRDESADPELTVAVGLDIEGPSDGRLGFEDIAELDADPTVAGSLDISWKLATAIDFGTGEEDKFPQLMADLDVHWGLNASLDDGLEVGDLTFAMNDVSIDLGSYADFLGEALKEVQRYLKPLQPVIDVVNAPIPGISDLAELVGLDPVTLITLLEAVAENDLTLLKRVLSLVSFVNGIASIDGGVVNFGDLGLNSASLLAPELPSTQKDKLIGSITDLDTNLMDDFTSGGDELASQKADGGFSFPVLEDPSKLFNILLGKDETLVHFDAGKLSAWASANWTFGPIAVGPIPLSINVSVGGGIEGHFAVGYDTKGIRELVRIISDDDTSNDGFWTGVGALFAGIFLDDLDKNGADVPEIRLTLEGAVGAAVDLVIVSAGVEAGLRATLDMNLHDGGFVDPIPAENLDGKLRIDEIITFRHNPICIFDVSGKIEAFIRLFVEIDLFLFSKKFSKTIINIVLLELDNITAELCDPPDPVLATPVGDAGVLRLNMGPHAGDRNFAEEEPDERFVVRRVKASDPDLVQVTAFGYVQEYDGVTKVIADGGAGDDSIKFLEGGEQTVAEDGTLGSTIIPFDIPTVACGGADDDTLVGGTATDHLGGDGALSGTDSCTTGEAGTDGADAIVGNEGDDVLTGHGGIDDIGGGDGDDNADGGTGDDRITGDEGKDTIRGGPDDAGAASDVDDLMGGPEAEPEAGDPADAAKDVIHGGDDIDTIEGDWGPDALHGGPDPDIIVGGHGDDVINGDGGEDRLFGNEGDDVIHGDADDDLVNGSAGDDELYGDGGDDNVIGGDGDDELHGGAGRDVLLGDNGEINRLLDPGSSSFAISPAVGADGITNGLVDLLADDPAGLPGDPGEDTIFGDDDPDVIHGQEEDDELHGGAGDDELYGAGGEDTMSGDAGGDVMFGEADDDTMHGDDATGSNGCADTVDTMRGGTGDDTMEGNADADKMWGDSGRDEMYGDADTAGSCDGNDAMYGGQHGDHMHGNGGGDAMDGGADVDRMIGGSDDSGPADGADVMLGQDGDDVMAGDNAEIADDPDADPEVPLDSGAMLVTLRYDGQGDGDTMSGGVGQDRMFGQVGIDVMSGDAGGDYVEGNQGADEIAGGAGDDDLIGGSSAGDEAGDGVVDDDRDGNDVDDVGDELDGGDGTDWIAGDNALISRNFPAEERAPIELFDLATTEDENAGNGDGGDDVVDAGDGPDRVFGQTGNDTIHGDDGTDYVEGGDGDDSIYGDGGADDLIGGGSAADGVIDDDRVGTTLLDGGETLISGGDGEDYITGDNALVNRNVPSGLPDDVEVQLFDVFTVDDDAADDRTSGPDTVHGDDGPDWMFGQGDDDVLKGGAGDDYVEGNEGDDAIEGEGDDDDLVGGSSADDGVIDWDRRGDGLRDGGETLISGGDGQDWITGDNALVNRNRPAVGPEPEDTRAPIELFDVEVAGGDEISTDTSGGDFVDGGADEDRIFAQGNGDQPASQTDPVDGRNNDFIGSDPGDDDFDRDDAAGVDEDAATWTGDIVHGGAGDDEIEGGHGNDLLFGGTPGEVADANDDEDDIVGGGSADDGVIDDDRLNRGANLLDGRDTIHGDGGDPTLGDDDVILGDNGWIVRTGGTESGEGPDGVELSLPNRDIRATQVETPAGTFGADHVIGNGGHDDIVGQGGDDAIDGEYGSDALVGDLGRVTVDLVVEGDGTELCGKTDTIEPEQPFYDRDICVIGTLFRLVELFAFEDTAPGVVAGEDVILGGDGDDWIHGGAGADLLQGDGDGGAEVQDPIFTYTQTITDPNPASRDEDRIFGGDSNGKGTVTAETLGNGDAIWGGRGPDFLYGGDGADNIDVRPPAVDSPYPATWTAWAQVDVESYHGVDHSWGGYDRDAMQSNVAGYGNEPGDRDVDWVGVYNLSLLCPAAYGGYVTIRAQSPEEIAFWEKSAAADGAFQPLAEGSSGYEDLSMIYKPDIKQNNGKAYPSTPGHKFACAP